MFPSSPHRPQRKTHVDQFCTRAQDHHFGYFHHSLAIVCPPLPCVRTLVGNLKIRNFFECLAILKTKTRKSQNHTTTHTTHRISLDLLFSSLDLLFSSLDVLSSSPLLLFSSSPLLSSLFSLLFRLSCFVFRLVFSSLSFSVFSSLSLSLSSFSLSPCVVVRCCCCGVLLCVLCCGVSAVWCGVLYDTLEKLPCAESKRPRVYRHHAHRLKHMYAWCR